MLGNIRFKLLIFPTAILNVKYIELSLFRILCGHALRATERCWVDSKAILLPAELSE